MNSSLHEKFDEAAKYIQHQLQHTTINNHPFPYIEYQVFNPEFCDFLKSLLPSEGEMVRLNQTPLSRRSNDKRKVFILKATKEDNVQKELTYSDTNTQLIYNLFNNIIRPIVVEKFSIKLPKNIDDELLYVVDEEGYRITPHKDITSKIFSVLVYTPDDSTTSEYGTHILEQINNDSFRTVRITEFTPGNTFIFPRSEKSWHKVPPVPEGVKRKLFIYTLHAC